MSRSDWETPLDVRELSEGPFGCPEVVERSSRVSGRGQEAHPEVREWSGCPPGGSGEVGGPSGFCESGR